MSVFLVLAAAELGMRVTGLGEVTTYRPDPRWGYLMQPGQRVAPYGSPVEINSLGLRGPELRDPKPPGVTRVMFLGDSITYAGGRVPEAGLFLRRLETLAAEHGLAVESVNVSAPGWSPQNWVAWTAANGLLGADLVVPVIPTIDLARPFARPEQHEFLERPPLLRLGNLWLKVRALRVPSVPLTEESLVANLAAIREFESRLNGVPLVAVFIPSQTPGDHLEWWLPYEKEFPDALDLRQSLEPSDFLDVVHLAASGHAKVGERIWERLRPQLEALAARPAELR
jgi:hypothetical protein